MQTTNTTKLRCTNEKTEMVKVQLNDERNQYIANERVNDERDESAINKKIWVKNGQDDSAIVSSYMKTINK